jgi:uncharacterized membrane protein
MIVQAIAVPAFPPIPDWSEIHPLIVHFPIVLLLVAPLFILGAMVLNPQKARPFLIAALALMVMGTVSAFVAVETGKAAAEIADRTLAASAVLERHEDLAHATELVFTLLTLIFATVLFLPTYLKKEIGTVALRSVLLAFLLLYGAGTAVLVNAAHNGGRLVHEFGIRSMMVPASQDAARPAPMHPAEAENQGP